MAKCLTSKSFCKRVEYSEGILRVGLGRRSLECKMLTLFEMFCLVCGYLGVLTKHMPVKTLRLQLVLTGWEA